MRLDLVHSALDLSTLPSRMRVAGGSTYCIIIGRAKNRQASGEPCIMCTFDKASGKESKRMHSQAITHEMGAMAARIEPLPWTERPKAGRTVPHVRSWRCV